jgi:hypothetical protein
MGPVPAESTLVCHFVCVTDGCLREGFGGGDARNGAGLFCRVMKYGVEGC